MLLTSTKSTLIKLMQSHKAFVVRWIFVPFWQAAPPAREGSMESSAAASTWKSLPRWQLPFGSLVINYFIWFIFDRFPQSIACLFLIQRNAHSWRFKAITVESFLFPKRRAHTNNSINDAFNWFWILRFGMRSNFASEIMWCRIDCEI